MPGINTHDGIPVITLDPATGSPLTYGAGGTASQVEGTTAHGASYTAPGINPVLIGFGNNDSGLLSRWIGFTVGGDGDAYAAGAPCIASLPHLLNAAGTWDRARTAGGAAGTTGTGLLGAGVMGFDGTNWQQVSCNAGTNSLCTAPKVLSTALGDTESNGPSRWASNSGGAVFTPAYPFVFNGSTWERQRSSGLGSQAVGFFQPSVKLALTVQAAAYVANDLVGGKLTFPSVTRLAGAGAKIRSILIGDQAANSAANSVYDLILFDSDPTGTTFTENSPLDVADADLNKIVGVVRFDGVAGSTLFTNADNNVIYKAVEIPVAPTTTSLFGALIARGGPTYSATTDVFITLGVEQY